jgi:hypothetical protein
MRTWRIVLAVLVASHAMPSWAGLYTDDLSRCLVEGTSKADKTVLVQWVVLAISQHPAVTTLSKGTDADIDQANAAVGELLMRLLTDTCRDKSKLAIRYEGAGAIQTAFGTLGQVATADLFSDPSVQKVMAGLATHLDEAKLKTLVEQE